MTDSGLGCRRRAGRGPSEQHLPLQQETSPFKVCRGLRTQGKAGSLHFRSPFTPGLGLGCSHMPPSPARSWCDLRCTHGRRATCLQSPRQNTCCLRLTAPRHTLAITPLKKGPGRSIIRHVSSASCLCSPRTQSRLSNGSQPRALQSGAGTMVLNQGQRQCHTEASRK